MSGLRCYLPQLLVHSIFVDDKCNSSEAFVSIADCRHHYWWRHDFKYSCLELAFDVHHITSYINAVRSFKDKHSSDALVEGGV